MTDKHSGADRNMLGIFLKYPAAGQVKTRLAAAIGPEKAAECYRSLAELVLAGTASSERYRRILFITPEERILDFVRWMPDESFLPQRGTTLGERMVDAFEQLLLQGERAALIGTDAPDVSVDLAAAAFAALDENDLVLGPALDGGYYLIGMKRPHRFLFEDIAWSTPSVLAATLGKAKALGLSCKLMQALGDIDTVEDYAEWQGRMKSQNSELRIQESGGAE